MHLKRNLNFCADRGNRDKPISESSKVKRCDSPQDLQKKSKHKKWKQIQLQLERSEIHFPAEIIKYRQSIKLFRNVNTS